MVTKYEVRRALLQGDWKPSQGSLQIETKPRIDKQKSWFVLGGAAVIVAAVAARWLILGEGDTSDDTTELVKPLLPGSDPDAELARFPVPRESLENTTNVSDEATALELEPHVLSEREIYNIIFYSFYHSQGNPNLQSGLFEKIMLEQHPNWELPKNFNVEEFSKRALEPITKMAQGANHDPNITKNAISRSLEKEVQDFVGISKGENDEVTYPAYKSVFNLLIDTELKYMEYGRSRAGDIIVYDSHFVRYLVEEKKIPGGSIYEEVYQALREDFVVFLEKDPSLLSLSEKQSAEKLHIIFSRYVERVGDITVVDPTLKELLEKYGLPLTR